jgi:cell wall-associated NlpC family hydrolase
MGASDDGALLLPPPRLMTQNLLEENPRVPQTPTTPPRLLAAASVFAAFAFPTFSAAPASAQQSGASSLDLTLNTGGGGSTARTTTISSPPKRQPRITSRGGSRSASLTSRGRAFTRQGTPGAAPQVLGRLAVVEVDQTLIRRDANLASRVLSPVPQGTYVAISAEQPEFYGVRMIDGSTGWVAKSDVRIVPYEMAVSDPNAPAPQPPPASDGDLQLPDGLDSRTTALFREAFTYLGVPYVWGGNGRAGLDCSAFVRAVFSTQGVSLPRVAADQARVGYQVSWDEMRPGDRLYFDMGNKGRVSHTGIYLGNGYFIHASSNQGKVGIDPLTKPGYYKALVCARRS